MQKTINSRDKYGFFYWAEKNGEFQDNSLISATSSIYLSLKAAIEIYKLLDEDTKSLEDITKSIEQQFIGDMSRFNRDGIDCSRFSMDAYYPYLAGINLDSLTIRLTEENWKKVLDINLTSTFLMCKSAIKKMIKNKSGKIINITSIVGQTGNFGQTNYSASKAGIVAFSKSLALEYAKKNININCVSPGFIKTEMTDKIPEEYKAKLIGRIPAGDLGTGDDVSNCVAFLASDMANYINGETIHVNGGMYMA